MAKLTELRFRYIGFRVCKGHFSIINDRIDDLMNLDHGKVLTLSRAGFTCEIEYDKDGVYEITCC